MQPTHPERSGTAPPVGIMTSSIHLVRTEGMIGEETVELENFDVSNPHEA